ncbi:MAG: hypothetical protein PG977_000854 [Bartonella clarridgeiae]|nr:MAG: hypothetical protein PG977_000854 [Bartonella clarridgeiae]
MEISGLKNLMMAIAAFFALFGLLAKAFLLSKKSGCYRRYRNL